MSEPIYVEKILYYAGHDENKLNLYIKEREFLVGQEFFLIISYPIPLEIESGSLFIYNGDSPDSEEEGVYKVFANSDAPFDLLYLVPKEMYKCTFEESPTPTPMKYRVVMELSERPTPEPQTNDEEVCIRKSCYYYCKKRCRYCLRRC